MSSRVGYIDIAKGLGILIIVLGHNNFFRNSKELYSIIFSFHVPLFLFLSGFFFKPNISLVKLIVKKSDSLLKPYFFTVIVLAPIYIIFFKVNIGQYFLFCFFYGIGATANWAPLWFLPHLFLLFIFSWFLFKILKIDRVKIYLQLLPIVLLLVIGSNYINSFWMMPLVLADKYLIKLICLPFSADLLLVTSFYFLLGYLLKDYFEKLVNKPIILVLAALCFLTIHLYFDYTIDLFLRKYDSIIFSTVLALLGIYIILSGSYFIDKFNSILSSIIRYIGQNSLIIYIFHYFLQNKSYAILSTVAPWFLRYNAFLSFIIAFSLSLLIVLIIKKIKILSLFYYPLNIIQVRYTK